MTSLQGVMGGHYAERSGESEAVAAAIAEQYDAVSRTKAGMAVAIADRLDSLTGLFAAGLAPKGSNDPFALRRAALHVIENLITNKQDFDLETAVNAAIVLQPVENEKAAAGVMGFINGRLSSLFRDKGYPVSVTKAVLAEQAANPYAADETAVALANLTQAKGWEALLDGYARCVRITRKETEQYTLTPAAFALSEEKQLYFSYEDAKMMADGSVDGLEAGLRILLPAITAFFDGVMVMDKETAVRNNRLALLQHIAALTDGIADLSELKGF
jgi:glycyl-tRNA synthetase